MSNLKTELKWALAFFIMSFIWMTLEKLVGLHAEHIDQHMIYTNFIAIPAIAIYVFALRNKRDHDLKGQMSYKQAFMSGLYISLIVTVLSPITQYITSIYITPEYFTNVINYSVSKGLQTQAEAEAYFNLNSYIIQGLIGAPVMGILTTAIVAFFVKTK
jgi:hypothetical protein